MLDAIRKFAAIQIHILLRYLDILHQIWVLSLANTAAVSRGISYGNVMLRRVESQYAGQLLELIREAADISYKVFCI